MNLAAPCNIFHEQSVSFLSIIVLFCFLFLSTMACVLLTGFYHHRMTSVSTTNSPTAGSYSDHRFFRYGYNRRWSEDEKGMGNNFTRTQIRAHKKRRLSFLPQACFALVTTRNSTLTNFYQEVIEAARERFTREISFQSKDKDISLAKVILFLVCYFCFELMMVSRRMIANPTYFLFVL
ncbi:uncharacterized protein LOC114269200 isoform X3 [Camellia sinensis]|uniref:uncharacterized protein LOC114269200 isoform X3 n=1 Tax=Camellia sinensis TaxID=4442 RepID=UPI0010361100|nr:uncharacterized protein LOC114269200 isoform X3 [Camellia sinensis]XP_028066271.1 uncharacterized protein LOC114269200 isoform X3 [Camellia sinensis]XP_028066272.1 uncharacterized protein LOC114269200 isoform X3 [Camellia sinensis]